MAEPMITKQCSKCKQVKPIDYFYKDITRKDGHENSCKSCTYLDHQTPEYKKQQAKYSKTQKGKDSQTRYKQSEKSRVQACIRGKKYSTLHPEIRAVQVAVYRAVKSGRLPDPTKLVCIYCGNKAKQYHHPNGYDNEHRFDVVPTCCRCHIYIHHYGMSSSGTKPVTEPLAMVLSEVPEDTEP